MNAAGGRFGSFFDVFFDLQASARMPAIGILGALVRPEDQRRRNCKRP